MNELKKPKIIFIFSTVPDPKGLGSEAVDLLLTLSAFESDIEVYFVEDGCQNIETEKQGKPRYTKRFGALVDFEIEDVFVVDENVERFSIPVVSLSSEVYEQRINKCTHVLRF